MTRTTITASVGPAMEDQRTPTDHPDRATRRETAAGVNQGMRVLSYLISGVLVYGALGWLGDHLLGTTFLLPIGIVFGAGLAVYVIIRLFSQAAGLGENGTSGLVPAADPEKGEQ